MAVWVAGRAGADGGVFRVDLDAAVTRRAAAVDDPVALAHHPHLPVLYALTVGPDLAGRLHAWSVVGDDLVPLGVPLEAGRQPCSLAIEPAGALLAVAAYSSGAVLLVDLAPDGRPSAVRAHLALDGAGPDPDRQAGSHPHQVLFDDAGDLRVIDLGADLLRRLAVPRGDEVGRVAFPPGAGPRHAAGDPGRLVVSAELSAQVLVERDGGWVSTPSTRRSGPARSRSARNYPGDIAVHPVAPVAYVANRGHDTLGVVDLAGPRLVDEVDAAGDWPQHLLVEPDRVLVACQDSSVVTALPVHPETGLPTGAARVVAQVPGACWLLAAR